MRRVLKVIFGKDFFEKLDLQITNRKFGMDCSWVLATDLLNKESIVYSFGIGKEISFDLAIIEEFGLSVNAFDPTPNSIEGSSSNLVGQFFDKYSISRWPC